jgi:membrane-associated phospholipid phosphatase
MFLLHTERRERFFARPRRGLCLGAGLLALFVVMALLVPTQPLAIEQHWADWMREIQTPVLEHVALVFNYLGRGVGRTLVLVGIGVVLIPGRRWSALLAYAATEALTPLLTSAVKALVNRPRPPEGLVHPTGAAFPSGHASFAGATCVAAVLLFTKPGRGARLWWALATAGIAGMAWSRTYLQVHWLLDVLAGSFLGAGIALLVFAALQLWSSATTSSHRSGPSPRQPPGEPEREHGEERDREQREL